jgi:hypothetical protein
VSVHAGPGELRQAVLWREAALERLLTAEEALIEAVMGVPVSVERVVARKALRELQRTISECRMNITHGQVLLSEAEAVDRG